MNAVPDTWALQAAALPLAFAQVREDPLLDLEIAASLPARASVIMIASGGETAVCLARLPLRRLLLVDLNAAQLSLTRCRLHLAATMPPEHSLALLGHTPMPADERGAYWQTLLSKWKLSPDTLGPPEMMAARGPDHCGRYEAAFAELRRLLQPRAAEIRDFLHSVEPAAHLLHPDTSAGHALDSAFARVLRLENLVALFGEEATQNPRQPFHSHFLFQLRDLAARRAPHANPFLWQMLAGCFPPQHPAEWLRSAAALQTEPEFLCAPMHLALEAAGAESADFIHLSNILDWLSPAAAAAVLTSAHRVLKPGGWLLLRQLNSSLAIPVLCPTLTWQVEKGRRLQQADRSFFYPEIHLAQKP